MTVWLQPHSSCRYGVDNEGRVVAIHAIALTPTDTWIIRSPVLSYPRGEGHYISAAVAVRTELDIIGMVPTLKDANALARQLMEQRKEDEQDG